MFSAPSNFVLSENSINVSMIELKQLYVFNYKVGCPIPALLMQPSGELKGKSAKLPAYFINDQPDIITHTREMKT